MFHFRSDRLLIIGPILIICMVIFHRISSLNSVGFRYVDSDQVIMWQGLLDYSKGIFHEPRFYGQAYNSMVEALFAVPLYLMSIPPYYALPIITTTLTILPYFILGLILFRRDFFYLSLFAFSLPLFLNYNYTLITSLPRGFVPGIFVSFFALLFVFSPNNKLGTFFVPFLSILGFIVNPNSAILVVPLCVYYFSKSNIDMKTKITGLVCGLLIGSLLNYFINLFYVENTNNIVHSMWTLDFSFKRLLDNLNILDFFFNDVTPFFWKAGFTTLLIFLLLLFVLWKTKQRIEFFTVLISLCLLILCLGINKILDGSNTVYFPYSRMFLAVPILLTFCLSITPQPKLNRRLYYCLLIIPAIYFFIQMSYIEDKVSYKYLKNDLVGVVKLSRLEKECDTIRQIAKTQNAQLVIFSNHFFQEFYAYGCECLKDSFPKTLYPNKERRTWRMLEDDNKIYDNIVIYDLHRKLDKEFKNISKIHTSSGVYVVSQNKLTTIDLLDSLKIHYRRFR